MLDTFTEIVCTRGGNSWCKVGCKTLYGLPIPPADILVAALTWLGRLHLEEDRCKIPENW